MRNKSKIKMKKRWTLERSCENLVQWIILLRMVVNDKTIDAKARKIFSNNRKLFVEDGLERGTVKR